MILVELQLYLIEWLQHFATPALNRAVLVVTYLGSEYAYLTLLPLVYWNVSPRCGYRVTVLFLTSVLLNSQLKLACHTVRPYLAYPDLVTAPSGAAQTGGGYAFPSGHAQGTTTVYGGLWATIRKPWLLALAVAIVGVVSVSRPYLGVHWPQDVLGGMLIGVCLVGAAVAVWRRWDGDVSEIGLRCRLGLAVAIPLLLFGLAHLLGDAPRVCGVMLGLSVAHVLAGKRLHDMPSTCRKRKALGSVLGLAVVAAIYVGGHYHRDLTMLGSCALYVAIGAWIPVAALLMRLGDPREATEGIAEEDAP